jgi:UDP-N-acetylglucosamine 2-epimerase (non-hydrolysing)
VIFPAHPRTAERLAQTGFDLQNVRVLGPVTYLKMLDLMEGAHAVITDSGGVQEETTVLGVPCLTLRENTERPITITQGTNRLVSDPGSLPGLVRRARRLANPRRPEGWDGHAGERVVQALLARTSRNAELLVGVPGPSPTSSY